AAASSSRAARSTAPTERSLRSPFPTASATCSRAFRRATSATTSRAPRSGAAGPPSGLERAEALGLPVARGGERRLGTVRALRVIGSAGVRRFREDLGSLGFVVQEPQARRQRWVAIVRVCLARRARGGARGAE